MPFLSTPQMFLLGKGSDKSRLRRFVAILEPMTPAIGTLTHRKSAAPLRVDGCTTGVVRDAHCLCTPRLPRSSH
jgi:hypothetical protein